MWVNHADNTSAVIWQHDDLVIDPRTVVKWLGQDKNHVSSSCIAVVDSIYDSELLPPVESWKNGHWLLPRLAAEGRRMISAGIKCSARNGAPLGDGSMWKGYSDGFAARRSIFLYGLLIRQAGPVPGKIQ